VTLVPAIAGITVTTLRQIPDDRGAVLHMLRADAPDFTSFGECYFSVVNPGAVKAWKRHLRQTQNLAVPVGRARFVFCDRRADSPTHGSIAVLELGRPDAYLRLRIPPLIWYGFTCVSEAAALIVNCADMPHEAGESEARAVEGFDVPGALELLKTGTRPA
jgi:dTDP-4-dehydrorhamnose 3,5-epimerase